jgi:hypothetical protein
MACAELSEKLEAGPSRGIEECRVCWWDDKSERAGLDACGDLLAGEEEEALEVRRHLYLRLDNDGVAVDDLELAALLLARRHGHDVVRRHLVI